MTTSELRNLNLTFLTEQKEIIDFLNDMNPSDFVELHQTNFKDHYLSEPAVLFDNDIFHELDLAFIISEKYRDFFSDLGLRASHRWLNPSYWNASYSSYLRTEDFTLKMILCEVDGGDFDEDICEAAGEMFSDLYYDTFSGWGLSHFILDVYDLYQSQKEEAA